jgi:hypothetical protein
LVKPGKEANEFVAVVPSAGTTLEFKSGMYLISCNLIADSRLGIRPPSASLLSLRLLTLQFYTALHQFGGRTITDAGGTHLCSLYPEALQNKDVEVVHSAFVDSTIRAALGTPPGAIDGKCCCVSLEKARTELNRKLCLSS